ncbi:hypothetical protein AKJ35_01120 [candidate division MSBL1 archaeon SCGC-AAA833F18]|uniref:RCK C-terminal domain-containing protein n=2 Tax=candidate division MSBL1 TaxID=215777 RepID=A0A133VT34_9EURY|nr:hypothetical protein AKJ35_01120 [candidate division MSBL1 archaeon SCGC-AAA833F18]KXB09578.1 hypothetical protein AKJ46_00070 [candidate division MSBL1 archaeon SCGC-AAA833K04]
MSIAKTPSARRENVTRVTDVEGYDLRQYTISEEKKGTAGELSEQLSKETGAFLVAIAKKDEEGGWKILSSPNHDLEVSAGDIVILLGTMINSRR